MVGIGFMIDCQRLVTDLWYTPHCLPPSMRLSLWAYTVGVLVLLAACAARAQTNAPMDEVEERVQSLEAEVSELRALAKSLLSQTVPKDNSESNLVAQESASAHGRRLQTYNGSTPALTFKVSLWKQR